jgi:hypothetical protein
MSSDLQKWAAELARAVAVLRSAGGTLTPPPAGEPGPDRLRALLAARQLFNVDDALPRPINAAATSACQRDGLFFCVRRVTVYNPYIRCRRSPRCEPRNRCHE